MPSNNPITSYDTAHVLFAILIIWILKSSNPPGFLHSSFDCIHTVHESHIFIHAAAATTRQHRFYVFDGSARASHSPFSKHSSYIIQPNIDPTLLSIIHVVFVFLPVKGQSVFHLWTRVGIACRYDNAFGLPSRTAPPTSPLKTTPSIARPRLQRRHQNRHQHRSVAPFRVVKGERRVNLRVCQLVNSLKNENKHREQRWRRATRAGNTISQVRP